MTRKWVFLVLLACAMFSPLFWELLLYHKIYRMPSSWVTQSHTERTAPSGNASLAREHAVNKPGIPWPFSIWFRGNLRTPNLRKRLVAKPSSETSPLQLTLYSQSYPSMSAAVSKRSLPTTKPLTDNFHTKSSADRTNGSKVLCVYFCCRLGNQLFQYASVLGLALTTKRIPVFLGDNLVRRVFKNTSLIDDSFLYTNRCKEQYRYEQACCKHFQGLLQLDPSKDYTIGTYLQSWRYFKQHETTIREALMFNDTIMSEARQTVASLRQKYNQTLTGVHVRRGDYLWLGGYGYKTAPEGYLLRAMNYVRERFSDVIFVVSSDDVEWCHKQFDNASDVVIMSGPPRSPALDMMILASLDHMIMTVGSYGWWASFLNPGITIYYRDFVLANSSLANEFDPNGTDYYYPGWIPLS